MSYDEKYAGSTRKAFLVSVNSSSSFTLHRSIYEMHVGQFRVCVFVHPTTSATESQMFVSYMNFTAFRFIPTPSTHEKALPILKCYVILSRICAYLIPP
ncbi:hypothetical protein CEXT_82191 [Caerostris extrusa]|uniref:Uncharacterized protein n=1 Tax=Caerostris extrusa TaxID=172846 RepID=A0AAV4QFM5_CAEEX|nr:hypothetical protein CEXT_82191 [Caerostris extrusa]